MAVAWMSEILADLLKQQSPSVATSISLYWSHYTIESSIADDNTTLTLYLLNQTASGEAQQQS